MSVILATGGFDHKIRFWEAPSGICSREVAFPGSQVNCLQITPDKQFLAAGGNPHIRLFEINNTMDTPVMTLEGHTASVTALGFQRDGRFLYSASEDGTVKLWDLRSPTYSKSFDCKAGVNAVALRPNCDEIVSGDQNGAVKLWDISTGKCVNTVIPSGAQKEAIQAVDSTKNLIVACSNRATVYVWDPTESSEEWEPVTKFRAHAPGTYLLHATFSPDAKHLVTTSSDHTAKLWDTTTWDLAQTLSQHTKWVWDAAFCADSSYLVTASSDHTARLWNLRDGEVVVSYTGHPSAVTCVALNDSSV